MRLAAILVLAAFPFIAVALLALVSPKHTWAAHYRRARERTAALADEVDQGRERLEQANARLQESQRRLRGEDA